MYICRSLFLWEVGSTRCFHGHLNAFYLGHSPTLSWTWLMSRLNLSPLWTQISSYQIYCFGGKKYLQPNFTVYWRVYLWFIPCSYLVQWFGRSALWKFCNSDITKKNDSCLVFDTRILKKRNTITHKLVNTCYRMIYSSSWCS